jgi:hypothetical protein
MAVNRQAGVPVSDMVEAIDLRAPDQEPKDSNSG